MGRAACKVVFAPVSLSPVSGKGSPWPSGGQAEVRSSRSMGFPSQPTRLPMAMPLFVLSIQCKCERESAGLFSPSCLPLSFEVPPGPFYSRHSSSWLKRSMAPGESCGISARDIKEYTRWRENSVPWQPTRMSLL